MEKNVVEQPGKKKMTVPKVSIQQLLEAGVHLGHKTLRWNPKMKKYIFGKKDSIHIIDLTQTLDLIQNALSKIYEVIRGGGNILIVSTKKQAAESVAELAKETSQFYVNYRWLGGMLTNWGTISNSDPTGIEYPIPGNDDARRAINLYCDLIKETITNAQKEIGNHKDKDKDQINDDDVKKTVLKKVTPIKTDAPIISEIKN